MDAPEGFTAVRRGGIVRFVPVPPQAVEKPVCVTAGCDEVPWHDEARCRACHRDHLGLGREQLPWALDVVVSLMAVFDRTLGAPWSPWAVCDDCGCLLRPDELCPNCVIPWIRAHDHVDDVVYYQPQKNLEERRAAA